MIHSDLPGAADVHLSAFPGFFTSRIGREFLQHYYAEVLRYQGGIALVAHSRDGSCIGLVTGFSSPSTFYAGLRSRWLELVPILAKAVLRSPSLLPEILENNRRIKTPGSAGRDFVELSSLAVKEQGRGLGSMLVRAFTDEARNAGARHIRLTTDADNNEGVNRFYTKHGFELTGLQGRKGRILCEYQLKL